MGVIYQSQTEAIYIGAIIKTSKQEAAVMLTTFLEMLFLDLEFALFAGVLLWQVIYLSMAAHPLIVNNHSKVPMKNQQHRSHPMDR